MKTFSDFILEARGESAEQIAKMRREAQAAMRAGNMDRYTELAQEIKELQSAEKIERERTQGQPAHKSTQKTPGGGRPQKPRDVITSGKTTKGSLPDVPSSGDDPQARGGRRVAGRYGNPAGTTGSGGTLRSRTGGVLGAG